MWGLLYLQANKSACPVCWILGEERRLPGQTRGTLLLTARAVRVSHSSQLPVPTRSHGGDVEQPGDTLHAQGVCITQRNPEPRQLKSFMMGGKQTCTHFVPKEDIVSVKPDGKQACSLLWRETSSLSSKAACSASTLRETGWDKAVGVAMHKTHGERAGTLSGDPLRGPSPRSPRSTLFGFYVPPSAVGKCFCGPGLHLPPVLVS